MKMRRESKITSRRCTRNAPEWVQVLRVCSAMGSALSLVLILHSSHGLGDRTNPLSAGLPADKRHFTIDGLVEPWKAFAGSWERREIARHLGIEEPYAIGDHRYVFVSISKNRSAGRWYVKGLTVTGRFVTTEEPTFNRRVAEASESIVPGDAASVQRFFRRQGTHYIASYATGESLYQVFVYDHSVHRNFETIMIRRGMGNFKLRIVSTILSPLFAVHLGKVQVASGNSTVREWVEENMEDHVMSVPHSTILKCFRNAEIRKRLEGIMSDGVFLRLDLKSIGPSIRNTERRKWFEEVVKNRLMLWEANA